MLEVFLQHLKYGTAVPRDYLVTMQLMAWAMDIDGFTHQPAIDENNCAEMIIVSLLPMLLEKEEITPWIDIYKKSC